MKAKSKYGRFVHELAVAMLITAGLSSLIVLGPSWQTRRHLEQQAAAWKPTQQDLILPSAELVKNDSELVGAWSGRHLGLAITRITGGEFDVEVRTGTCVVQCKLHRTAEFQDGVLRISKPIAHYGHSGVFETVYLVKVADNMYLVPASAVQSFNEQVNDEDYHGEYRPLGSLTKYDGT